MQKHTASTAVCEGSGPCLPSGAPAGIYIEEDARLIWERGIKRKHILRLLDALTVNVGLVRQIQRDGVQLIRYKLDGDGTYEIALSAFLEKCSILHGFAAGEDVFALPRDQWDFEARSGNGQLLLFMKRDDE